MPLTLAPHRAIDTDLFTTPTLQVRPWADPVIDTLGHDPRSTYVEQFWLGILGPSTTWLLRRVATAFDAEPDGFEMQLSDTAREIGLGDKGGRHSPFMRAFVRCCQFDVARPGPGATLEVRRKLPPLNRRQIVHLPESLQHAHETWQRRQLGRPAPAELHQRARHLALSLVQLGEDRASIERQLLRWRFHPALCHEATAWAWERHQRARATAT